MGFPDIRVVPTADLSPSRCFFCHTDVGPFIDMKTVDTQVPTADGPKLVRGHVYVCIGNEQSPGCVAQMVEHPDIQGAAPWSLTRFFETARERIEEREQRIRELETLLGESQSREGIRVVPVDELIAGLGSPLGNPVEEARVPAHPYELVEVPDGLAPPDLGPPAPPHPDSRRVRGDSHRADLDGKVGAIIQIQ